MEDDYYFVISRRARNDLESIFSYISDVLLNQKAADNLIECFYTSFKNLCSFPKSCEQIDNEYVKDSSLRKLLVKNYIAFYRIKGKQIQIVRVLYGMSDYLKIL